jgi:hypothetical protein
VIRRSFLKLLGLAAAGLGGWRRKKAWVEAGHADCTKVYVAEFAPSDLERFQAALRNTDTETLRRLFVIQTAPSTTHWLARKP